MLTTLSWQTVPFGWIFLVLEEVDIVGEEDDLAEQSSTNSQQNASDQSQCRQTDHLPILFILI